MKYNYYEQMRKDIMSYIEVMGYNPSDYENKDNFVETLEDELWIEDSVTGNGSGSYTFNTRKTRECIAGNEGLFVEAAEAFGIETEGYKRALEEPDYMDVIIRCYLLNQVLWEIADELERKGAFKKSVSQNRKSVKKKPVKRKSAIKSRHIKKKPVRKKSVLKSLKKKVVKPKTVKKKTVAKSKPVKKKTVRRK